LGRLELNMAKDPSLPGGSQGQFAVGGAGRLIGLAAGGTPAGSGVMAYTDAVLAITFPSALWDEYEPLILDIQLLNDGTPAAGKYAMSTDGVANVSTVKRTLPATGLRLFVNDLFKRGGTLYILADADPGSDGIVEYSVACATAQADR